MYKRQLLRGLEELIEDRTGINTMTADEPMTCVAIGTGKFVEFLACLLYTSQTVLFDTVDASVAGQFFENLEAALEGRTLDYLIVNHMEPDHGAMICDIVRRYPACLLYTSSELVSDSFVLLRFIFNPDLLFL